MRSGTSRVVTRPQDRQVIGGVVPRLRGLTRSHRSGASGRVHLMKSRNVSSWNRCADWRSMAGFDVGWWDAKTLSLDGVDTTGDPMTPRLSWIRWRLIDELLCRYYQDLGLEVGFGPLGMELYNDPVWSPNCKRAPRYFGRLCANHAHTAMNDEWPDRFAPTFPGGRHEYLQEGTWGSWTEYLHDTIHVMGLDTAGVPGHERCWHRRAKAILPCLPRGVAAENFGGAHLGAISARHVLVPLPSQVP